jgi:RNA polymerase sigma-70 factor, ECF subfamily
MMEVDHQEAQKRFTVLYDTHARALLAFAYYRLMDRALAEDLVADTFCKIWQQLVRGATITQERALLYTILRGLIIDQYRKQEVRKRISQEHALHDLYVDSTIAEVLDTKQTYTQVLSALHAIKQEYAEVLTLHYLQELSVSEIAHILDKTENTVRVRIHRALNALRTSLHV